jgi:hypothetical protein
MLRVGYRGRRPDATIDAIIVATAELVGGRALLTRDADGSGALAQPLAVRVQRP